MKNIAYGYCHCGCGKKTPLATRWRKGYRKGEPTRFLHGHNGGKNATKTYKSKIKKLKDGTFVKHCTCCKKDVSVKHFNKSLKHKDHLRSHCKNCERRQAKEFYHKNPVLYKQRSARAGKKIRSYLTAEMNRIKAESGCIFCGIKELCVLDFHHHIKGKPVTHSVKSYTGFNRELRKCIVACANCHRRVHAGLLTVDKSMLCKEQVGPMPTGHI